MRSWKRPLEPSEISWILEGKIRGTIPIRMFPHPGSGAAVICEKHREEIAAHVIIPICDDEHEISGFGLPLY